LKGRRASGSYMEATPLVPICVVLNNADGGRHRSVCCNWLPQRGRRSPLLCRNAAWAVSTFS